LLGGGRLDLFFGGGGCESDLHEDGKGLSGSLGRRDVERGRMDELRGCMEGLYGFQLLLRMGIYLALALDLGDAFWRMQENESAVCIRPG
jgi:hypothetical protein